MEETVLSECARSWKNAKDKRKAWAKSRDSWQNSEANDRETTEDNSSANLQLSGASTEENGISNKKIEIWLQDCGEPLGASLDEQGHPMLKGAVTKNGCSFEDDLSLGAEANYLHPHSNSLLTVSGTSAEVKRNKFYQMGSSMNSTGSGKSNATVSSVSELLDLYEEDPEDVLYNLGFGTDEPDLASKIPCRFFNASSFAKGIDFKLFLDAQMQRMELDNPNFALTSRFRQIKVLTTVANVFSSLYSQVSGAPVKRIGDVADASTAGQVATAGNNAGRLKKTVSKLNLFGGQQVKATDTTNQTVPAGTENSKTSQCSFETDKSITDDEKKEEVKHKKEMRLQKWRKLTDPSLKPVTEEVMTGSEGPLYPSECIPQEPACNVTNGCIEPKQNDAAYTKGGMGNSSADMSSISDSSIDLHASTDEERAATDEQTSALSQENTVIESTSPVCSTTDKGLAASMHNPLVSNLMEQKEFSFDLEEVQSNEGEGPNPPGTRNPVPHGRISATNKEHFTRTSSSHSDSSGFAEDPSSDVTGLSQGPDGYLQAMGSSADSCDSETTVTSLTDDLKTPLSADQKFFTPFQTPVKEMTLDLKETILDLNVELISDTAIDSPDQQEAVEMDGEATAGLDGSIQSADQTALGIIDGEGELDPKSDVKCESEEDVPTYSMHPGTGQRRKSIDSVLSWHPKPDAATSESIDFSSSSLDKITTVLERAKTQTYSVSIASGRARRPVTKANDRIMREGERVSKNDTLAKLKRSSFQRSSSLPSKLLNPVRVISSLNVQLAPDSNTQHNSPSFTYRYSAQKEGELPSDDENDQSMCRSMLFIPTGIKEKSRKPFTLNKQDEAPQQRLGSQTPPVASHLTRSCCSLHTLPSDWQDQPLCGHARTRSMCSIPNFVEPTCASPFGYMYPQRPMAHSYHHSPINPPSAIESQLRRVLTEIRSTVQNLSRIPIFQGNDLSFPYYPLVRSGLLPIYESTYQELQIMRRNLNFFRTQMMDLEFMMLRQQTMVYRHLTDEERQEADQLQNLRNCVRMELQELELQLEERSFALEEQLKAPSQCPIFRPPSHAEAFTNNADAMSSSSFNVMEPVSELLREQSYLRSALGFSEQVGEEYDYPHSYYVPCTNMESASRSSSPGRMSRCSAPGSISHGPSSTTAPHGKPVNQATSTPLQSRQVYRSSVLLTPSPPARAAQGEPFTENRSSSGIVDQNPISQTSEPTGAAASPSKGARSHIVEHPEFHNVLQEIKESIVGEIKREIMGGLLAAISPAGKDVGHKEE
ncbi:protein ITPRID2 [Pristis pectinata]|uniref:protein ITPRID2 n=1 Tax=Pristis pectinata TaxID=685728 RepID=UPI00223D0363|nr:protein ITPRID2 [Pristis pectinata]XP_051868911.1 protein ITPRID2 [Pristis pectinata]XP_051868916.1 protein ITPRID2 [Pristis pectinata]XP_051868923.1 protein ITPRID2 [Pristis pectinata]XP_051868933.1 protein ITPRID2 [Pristis pectinata]XP_051868942.1 protein ITPRID2 [Pristis pectinata]XP_051868948.1 protein ITPRID2 [Pristis pectinata]XP_051868958.1 protein ITPRID2 [Pristis pectinata]